MLCGLTKPTYAASECFELSQVPADPVYTVVSPPGAGNADIQDLGSLEERVTVLSSTFAVTYQCTDTDGSIDRADVQVRMSGFQSPSTSTGGTNLDVPSNGTEAIVGVNHHVAVELIGDASILKFGNTAGLTDIVNRPNFNPRGGNANFIRWALGPQLGCSLVEDPGGRDCILDGSDQITIVITSTFVLTGGAEEFLAGNYSATFRTRVRPDDNNADAASGTTGGSNPRTNSPQKFTTITYTVAEECSINTQSAFSLTGNPVDYARTNVIGGSSGDIQDNGTPEERAIRLSATDNLGVDCNTPNVEMDVTLAQFSRPAFTNATNLVDIDHEISVLSPNGNNNTVLTSVPSTMTNVPILTNQIETTDANADLTPISLTSTLSANSEELASGNYRSNFMVTVTAQ